MPDNNYEMKIVFAGDSIIKIIAEVIEVTLDDQGEAWDTKNIPKHIPKENVYMTAHWMVYVSYACLLGSLYLLINGAFFG